MRIFATTAILALGLSGCTITPENAYPEAMSVAECQARYEEDVRTTNQSLRSQQSSGNWLADAVAGGIGAGVAESTTQTRLAVCLQRVGATESEMRQALGLTQVGNASVATPPLAPRIDRPASCPATASVLYGGTGYCVGR